MTNYVFELNQENFLAQFREDQVFEEVSDDELSDQRFRLDALKTVREDLLTIPHRQCADHIADRYRDVDGYYIDDNEREIYLDLKPLWEMPDEAFRDSIQTSEPRTTAIRLRQENRERLRLIFNIYRGSFPEKSALWGIHDQNTAEA